MPERTYNAAKHLASCLDGHKVDVNLQGGDVLVNGTGSPARIWAEQIRESTVLYHFELFIQGQKISDEWVGLGSSWGDALYNGFDAFVKGAFHVLLAAAWGVLETDQVEHTVVSEHGHTWDLYEGPWVGRAVADANIRPPKTTRSLAAHTISRLGDRIAPLWGRMYVAYINGEWTHEVLVNGQLDHQGIEYIQSSVWTPVGTGFASRRLFWIAVPRVGESPTHERIGTCG